jgi:chromosome segregation ATPase
MSEVEQTLREIRDRVRAEAQALAARAPDAAPRNGDEDISVAPPPARDEAAEAFARMEANLATAERAYAKLPPLQSNRAGLAARVELWVKRKIKRAAHWFTWEQVNFNSASYHALRDALAALRTHESRLAEARAELAAGLEGFEARLAELRSEMTARHAEVQARLAELRSEVARVQAHTTG